MWMPDPRQYPTGSISAATSSDCFLSFGHADFDPARISNSKGLCPVRGCDETTVTISIGCSRLQFCNRHGLRLHSNTFVYWNGVGRERAAQLRNFVVRPDLADSVILGSTGKAETQHLGHETSEDALTWNVFVGIAQAGRLRELVRFLTSLEIDREPRLYLWGELVDTQGGAAGRFAPLEYVRRRLESDIVRYKTEPDIMLVLPDDLIVCIEAKFCSGNPLADQRAIGPGEKPADRLGLLHRYLKPATRATQAVIDPAGICQHFHSQLFRNIIFASEMAAGTEWRVVNLISETQWESTADSRQYSFGDPSPSVRSFLVPSVRDRFQFRTWEGIQQEVIEGNAELRSLNAYMQTKSARYRPAFQLRRAVR